MVIEALATMSLLLVPVETEASALKIPPIPTVEGVEFLNAITNVDITASTDNNAITSEPEAVPIANTAPEKMQTFEVTAYTNGAESTGKSPDHPAYGITASGAKTRANHTIACAQNKPFGTQIYIPHFDTTFTCEDRGGAIKQGRIDVYMDSVNDARQFGRRALDAKVIN